MSVRRCVDRALGRVCYILPEESLVILPLDILVPDILLPDILVPDILLSGLLLPDILLPAIFVVSLCCAIPRSAACAPAVIKAAVNKAIKALEAFNRKDVVVIVFVF